MTLLKKISIITKNLKLILFNLNLIITILIVIVSTFFFSYENLDMKKAAIIFEYFISLIGIFVYPIVFTIDANNSICDIVRSKKTPYIKVLFIRFIMVFSSVLFIIIFMSYYVNINGGNLNEFELVMGTVITSLFLGSISMLTYSFSNNISISYLISFMYYFMEFGSNGKITKKMFLFSLTKGYYVYGKNFLLILALCTIFLSIYMFPRIRST